MHRLSPAVALSAAILIATPFPALAQTTVVSGATVIDTAAGGAIADRVVVVEGRKITVVTPAAGFQAPAGATVIDATGKFLLPGLFDAHVHYADPDTYNPLMLAHGVVFVRDMGNVTESVIELRRQLNSGEMLGPEMACTGAIIDGVPPVWPFSEACETPEEARAAVRKLHSAGVDQIKIYSRLKKDVYEAAIAEARAVGLKAVGHIPNACTVADAVAAGQASNEHLMVIEKILADLAPDKDAAGEDRSGGLWPTARFWFLYPQVNKAALRAELKKIADAGFIQCPTLVVQRGVASIDGGKADDDPRVRYVSAPMRSFWGGEMYKGYSQFVNAALPFMKSMVGDMHAAGVPLIIGTDLANPYVFAGASVHDELRMLVEGGVPAAEALRAATLRPAEFLGVADRLGTIAPGKDASFLVLKANPLDDIANTLTIDSVFFRGTHHDRAALDAMMAGVLATVAASAPAANAGEIVLDLPGEVVLRGTYALMFGPWDAGTEDVLITKTAEGYSMMAHSKPQGGPQSPSLVVWHAGPDFAFKSATYTQLTQEPTEATYSVEGGEFKARAARGGGALPEVAVAVSDASSLSSPSNAGDFFALGRLALAPGESRTLELVGFGYPGWEPQAVPYSVTREPDAELARPDGSTVKAQLYSQTLTTPMGAFKAQTWTDERGVVLKIVTAMPFGTMTAELKQETAK